ncbi:MAG: hypothetical protein LRY41_01150 [Candidatus Pacebacteria bacterium]|nr:hypothetical protein [Candidatus Paceibacterota bacterium]MCD8508403.1 hypothetical protein [Candidatus Paceibacterota bacterium]MCD8527924.1 hypothetical protein [Candidatus Paceibacterota bacterium]MCD8563718.1 hypothetical protein [Candidatus Paceibacterota bacterium]
MKLEEIISACSNELARIASAFTPVPCTPQGVWNYQCGVFNTDTKTRIIYNKAALGFAYTEGVPLLVSMKNMSIQKCLTQVDMKYHYDTHIFTGLEYIAYMRSPKAKIHDVVLSSLHDGMRIIIGGAHIYRTGSAGISLVPSLVLDTQTHKIICEYVHSNSCAKDTDAVLFFKP